MAESSLPSRERSADDPETMAAPDTLQQIGEGSEVKDNTKTEGMELLMDGFLPVLRFPPLLYQYMGSANSRNDNDSDFISIYHFPM